MTSPESYGVLREKSILFGDDEWGYVADERPKYKRNGIWYKQYLIVPFKHLVKTYPDLQKPTQKWVKTRLGDAIWREYPEYLINDTNNSRTNAIVRIYCGFDGRETFETERIKKYTEEIKDLSLEIDRVNIQNLALKEENKSLLAEEQARALRIRRLMETLKVGEYEKKEFME
jgi:hypothetical protein